MFDDLGFREVTLIGSVFMLILSMWCGGVFVLSLVRKRREEAIRRRLSLPNGDEQEERVLRLWRDGKEITTSVRGGSGRLSLGQRLDRLHREAGFDASYTSMLGGLALGCVVGGIVTFVMTGSVVLAGTAAAALVMVYRTYLLQRTSKRRTLFENQLIDALELAARSLRAGHPLAVAFRLVGDETPDPVGAVFSDICEQQTLGATMEGALRQAAASSAHSDFKLFAVSVAIQLRSGGNLADMMDRLAFVIRDRLRLNRRVRVLTAQTQFSKRVLIVIPILLFVMLSVVSPDYMDTLYSTHAGHIILVIAVSGLMIGGWIMNRLAVLRY